MQKKNDNLLKTKRILKLKYKPSGDPGFAFSLPERRFDPASRHLCHCNKYVEYWLNKIMKV